MANFKGFVLAIVIKSFTRLRLFFGTDYLIIKGRFYCWQRTAKTGALRRALHFAKAMFEEVPKGFIGRKAPDRSEGSEGWASEEGFPPNGLQLCVVAVNYYKT